MTPVAAGFRGPENQPQEPAVTRFVNTAALLATLNAAVVLLRFA